MLYDRAIAELRNLAAVLACLSGASQIGALWVSTLDLHAVLSALLGTIYLFVGIGLFGQSRFVLFIAIAMCSASAYFSLDTYSSAALGLARLCADIVIVAASTAVLWAVRHRPSL
jgi:hypothetical protein